MTPTLTIHYSLTFEESRIRETIGKRSWYREHGYAPFVLLPGGQSLAQATEELNGEEILARAREEYREDNYREIIRNINEEWKAFSQEWEKGILKNLNKLNFAQAYDIHLTRYGTGGSYKLPNTVILNIDKKSHKSLISSIVHEMIHLAIEPYIRASMIPQWKKERLVDLLFQNIFPTIAFKQNVPEDALEVDSYFAHDRDIETIIKSIGERLKQD